MKVVLCLVVAIFAWSFNSASASSQGGAEWKFLQFETIDGETISVRVVDSSTVAIKIRTQQCFAHFPKVAVSEGPLLWNVEYFVDQDEIGQFHLLNIPSLTLESGKQIHKSNVIYIRNCKIERIESSVEAAFPA